MLFTPLWRGRKVPMLRRFRLLSAVVFLGAFAYAPTGGAQQPAGADTRFVPGEMVVQYTPDASPQAKNAARARVGATAIELITRGSTRADRGGDLELVRIPPGLAVADAVRGIRADGNVTFAEPNWIYTHGLVSNDPHFTNGSLWGMYGATTSPANANGSGAAAAWGAGHVGATNVYVGIIDEGVMPH